MTKQDAKTAKKKVESSMSRVRSTASCTSSSRRAMSSPRPGASTGTIQGASTNATTQRIAVPAVTKLSIVEASRHALASPSRP